MHKLIRRAFKVHMKRDVHAALSDLVAPICQSPLNRAHVLSAQQQNKKLQTDEII